MQFHTVSKYTGSLLIIIICLVLSAYFSATETAFASLNRIRIRNMADKGNGKAALVLRLLDRYNEVLSTILIGNNLVNIAATSLATVIFVQQLGEDMGSGAATLVTTLVLLIFGEISPKTLATELPERFACVSAPFLRFFMQILTPVNFLFGLWKRFLGKVFRNKEDRTITEEELLTYVEEAESGGGLDEQESDLIRNSIEFSEQEVQDVLTPRVDIVGIRDTDSKEEIADLFAATGYSRLPVWHEDVDHITGIIYLKDFYNKVWRSDLEPKDIVRPVLFVIPQKKIDEVLKELQLKKLHMAVVLDEYGGTLGIVTMEDILEELVGEIWDEHDEVVHEIVKISDTEYLVRGSANLEDLFDELDIRQNEEVDAPSVSGWVMDMAGAVPKEKDVFRQDGLRITVLDMDGRRVDRVRINVEEGSNL